MASSPASNLASLPGESQGSSSSSSSSSKGSFQKYLTNCKSLYSCIYCRTHLANHDELVSRSFQGNHGRAYLFKSVINVSCGPAVQRDLNTGPHAVADIFCSDCERTLGWKYEKAYVESQKYKEGKYIIELAHVVRENRHLELDKGEMYFSKRDKYRSSSSNFQNISSKLPPSPTNCSPTSRYFKEGGETRVVADDDNDDDDEELMFPFYEDLLACQSSSVSLSHHQRLRRSLYLDSTPYDWKYSTSSASSPRQSSEVGTKIASSLDSGSDLSPSKSSSSDNSLDNRQMSYHISGSSGVSSSSSSSNKNLVDTTKGADSLASRYQNQRVRNTRSECDNNNNNNNNSSNNNEEDIAAEDDINENYDENDDDGTQFRFEEDKPNSNLSNDTQTNKMQCDHIISDDSVIIAQCSSNSQIERTSMNNRKDVNELASRESENDISDAEMSSSGRDPIVLDDETFYDCYTDHAITNSISESSSTLEQ